MSADLARLLARLLMAALFIVAGANKIGAYEASQAYMNGSGLLSSLLPKSLGVRPGVLLPAVIALELVGGLMIAAGFHARLAALALGTFCVAAAALYHNDLANYGELVQFLKNLAIAGGMLLLWQSGPGAISVNRK